MCLFGGQKRKDMLLYLLLLCVSDIIPVFSCSILADKCHVILHFNLIIVERTQFGYKMIVQFSHIAIFKGSAFL